jgi:hypothetical protein
VAVFNGVATAIATIAALAAVYYARRAVLDTATAQQKAHEWRQQDLEAQRQERQLAETAHIEQIGQLRQLQADAAAQHLAETTERKRALAAEVRVNRAVALQRIADLLLELADTARSESVEQPPKYPDTYSIATRIPALLARLRLAVEIYEGLGGTHLAAVTKIAHAGYHPLGTKPSTVVADTMVAFNEIEALAHNDPALRPADG